MPEQVAIITGAGGGIGRAIAIELSRSGYRLALVGRTEASLLATRESVGEALILPADISRPESADLIVRQTLDRFGRIDALVNNAGKAPVLTVEQTTPQIWRETIDINLSGPFYLCRAAWPTFRKQQSGAVVNISSLSARDPFPGFAAYGAAKAGLITLGISLAEEGHPMNVNVYTLAPGSVETPMLRSIVSKELLPPDQVLTPQRVARVVHDCVTGVGSYHSGEVIWLTR